jgi:glycosyltransferase involved in cell wall biosynthesis
MPGGNRVEMVPGGRPKRILVVIENVPFARDHRARKQVESLLGAGYGVSVICRRDAGNARFRNRRGLRLYEYRAPAEFRGKLSFAYEYTYSWLAAAVLTAKALADGGFDAIQVGHPPDIYSLLALPFRLVGKPFIVDQRDLSPELFSARYGRDDGPLPWLLRAFEKLSWSMADHVLCVNETLRRAIIGRGSVRSSAVSVVMNGPVLSRTAPRPPTPELKQGKRFLICWVGLMGLQDHVDLTLQAIHHLVHDLGRDDFHVALIGEGEELFQLRRLADRLAIADRVTFTRWLDEETCFDYLATADLALDSSLQAEVSPVKAMEYMAFGIPFVAFDLEETRAMAREAAAYVQPADTMALAATINELLDDPGRRQDMGLIGRRLIREELAWDRQEETYLRVFERLLRPARPVGLSLGPKTGLRPPS